jgi:fimbrial isopeptide formation D2 family protein/LPXTG-motif cell wall-anchored protein
MKLMKRILAIVSTFVMIISMATGVNAVDNTSAAATAKPTTGTITVTNAKAGEEYKVYKILSLESYEPSKDAYSYVRTGDKWDGFVNKATAYLDINNDEYVTFKSDKDNETGRREFALKAMQYVKDNNIDPTDTAIASEGKDTDITVTFKNLSLGYYLVESSVGTACSLGTTNPNAKIKDKHDAPTINKEIATGDDVSGTVTDNGKKNSVNIGDVVGFKVTIYVKPNAKNYVLHDVMDEHLQFLGIQDAHANLKDEENPRKDNPGLYPTQDFVVKTNTTHGCTFEVEFTNQFYEKYRKDIDSGSLNEITFTYGAQVKDNAPINKAMPNTAHLTYGDHSTTDNSQTNTYTWGIPVHKYTENGGNKVDLAGAKFILSTDEIPTETNALKFTKKTGSNYRFDSTNGSIELESYTDGMINIQGLKSGTYYLKETKAPDGYNVLKTPIKIVVKGDDKTGQLIIKVKDEVVTQVEVQNNKGSLLPSTGGMGTTLIYVVGSILVLASGIVLFSKRKEGTN